MGDSRHALMPNEAALLQALQQLENKIQSQFKAMQHALTDEKPLLQAAIQSIGRRQADVEWKLQRSRPEWMFNTRAAAFFNSNLFSMKSPFLSASSIKRTIGAAEGEAEDGGVPMTAENSMMRARPQSSTAVACRNFESPETRMAVQEGREVRIKGSAAAYRIYRRNVPTEPRIMEIPPSLEHLFEEDPAPPPPRPKTPANGVLPNVVPRPMMDSTSDAEQPWQMSPGTTSRPVSGSVSRPQTAT